MRLLHAALSTTVLLACSPRCTAFAVSTGPLLLQPSLSTRLYGGAPSVPRVASPNTARKASSLAMSSDATFKLFGNQGTRSPLVTWYLEEIGAPYQTIDATAVDRSKYPTYPHPFGSIPACSDEGGVGLFESGAILMFIADKYGGLDTPEKRAEVGKWVMWANASLDPICFMENERGQVVGTRLAGEPKAVFVLDKLLSQSDFLLGNGEENFSVADVAVASYVLYALLFNRDLKIAGKWPNLAKYCNKAAMRPCYIKAFGESTASSLAKRALA